MNINHEPVATPLMIDIKLNQREFWLTFDIKRTRPRPPVGRGNSSGAPGQRARSRPPGGQGRLQPCQSEACDPVPPLGRGAPVVHQSDAAPSLQEEPAACQSGVRDPGNRWAGRASAANQSCVRAPSPRLAGELRLPARASCAPPPIKLE